MRLSELVNNLWLKEILIALLVVLPLMFGPVVITLIWGR